MNGGTNGTNFDLTMNSVSTPSVTDTTALSNVTTIDSAKLAENTTSLKTVTWDTSRDGASHFSGVSSFTSTDGITRGKIDNSTLQTYESNVSTTLVVGVVVPVLIVVVVVSIILICVFRKRGCSKENVRVWQIERTHTIPTPKPHASWYEEDGAEVNSGFNPDIELQPSNIFTNSDAFNHDVEIAAEKDRSFNSSYEEKETEVFGSDDKSYNLKDYVIERDGEASNTDSDPEITEKHSEDDIVVTREAASAVKESTMKTKRFQIVENTIGDYDLAGPIGGDDVTSENEDTDTNGTEDKKRIIANGDVDDGEYVAMQLENNDSDNVEQFQENQLRYTEDDADDIYTNVDIRRVQSMQVTSLSYLQGENQPEEHLPKRIASECGLHSSRPPVAQPRVSKKKRLDPNDFLPAVPVRAPVNETQRSTTETTFGQALHEEQCSEDDSLSDSSGMTVRINGDVRVDSDTDEPKAEDLYDYPRPRSQVYEDDDPDSIYKVPPSRYS
ncbi:uncharacterized protein LOC123523467 [Mercenaria mercenaria]|uniref:uncharacterized protein LOC123523467 n=1 Tax=Mercenaria mercenaria TaxID=6596 RepID=UPI00234E57FD|nr:uncharacterized protein LOC123523467 [Mercenaria mercenaria]